MQSLKASSGTAIGSAPHPVRLKTYLVALSALALALSAALPASSLRSENQLPILSKMLPPPFLTSCTACSYISIHISPHTDTVLDVHRQAMTGAVHALLSWVVGRTEATVLPDLGSIGL